MKKHLSWLVMAAFMMGAVLAAPAAGEVDITGIWEGETMVPDAMDPDVLTMELKKVDGQYQGTISDQFGYCEDAEIRDFEFKANKVTFNFTISDGSLVYINLSLDGDTLTGAWETEDGGGADVIMNRKK